MKRIVPIFVFILSFLTLSAAWSLVVDDFESGDLSGWYIEPPHYTTLSLSSPGAGGSTYALSIQETAGSQGAHSANALAHRVFTAPLDWSSYTTLQFEAKISAGEWNGYSIRVYNDNTSVLLRGIHSDSSISGFRTISFDISGIQRDRITEIVIYVNKTRQDAGQTLTIDNIRVTNEPVTAPPIAVLEDFSSGNLERWSAPVSPPYQTNVSITTDDSPNDASSPTRALSVELAGTSTSALVRWRPAQTMDWYDYKTLEFDVKLAVGTTTDGFSIRLYNAGTGVRLKKFVPGSNYVTCQVDISAIERDQVNELLFYVNRTGAYDPSSKPMKLYIDYIRLTKNQLPPSPDVVWLDTFDTGSYTPWWDWAYQTSLSINGLDFISSPYSLDIKLTGTSTSAYTRRSWIVSGGSTQDWEDYRSLIFEAKVLKGDPAKPNYPIGFAANIVSGPGGGMLWFYPSGYDNWETIALDLTPYDVDQVSWLRIYVNRCARNDYDVATGAGQIVRIDNLRVSKEPAPPTIVDNPNVDDFEDGNIDDWYYRSTHEYPSGSGTYMEGVSSELTTDAASGRYALKITCLTPPGSSSAYARKTLHADWSKYKTLVFDAKVEDSSTSYGFGVRLRSFSGYAQTHEFCPTNQWQTFKIDISQDKVGTSDARNEVIGLLFYVNGPGMYGVPQSGAQKLYIDNIRLTTETLQTTFSTIGEAKEVEDGRAVTLEGKICTGFFADAFPDKNDPSTLRPVFFLEEPDRSAAIPVVISKGLTSPADVPEGSQVNVTGIITSGFGTRYLYATSITIVGSGFDIPKPVGLPNKACGGGSRGLDAGVPDFFGRETNGMYATVCGRVLAVGSDMYGNAWMYIDDGSRVQADNGAVGLKVYDYWYGYYANEANIGKFAVVNGFVMTGAEIDPNTQKPTGRAIRVFWPKKELAEPIRFLEEY